MNSINEELFEAVWEVNPPEVRRLLRAGADVNARDDDGWTPLHKACHDGHVQLVSELLDHGADIESTIMTTRYGSNTRPLHCACINGHLAVGNQLLSRGANIDTKDNQGNTPLHFSSWNGHLPVVKALVSGGANILVANNEGEVPIHYAVKGGSSEVAKYLLLKLYATTPCLPLHELLKDITWIGNPGIFRYALHRNVLGTDDVVEILEYLVGQNPALLSSLDEDGSLPLHVACRRGAPFAIVQSLVNFNKASVKSVTRQGDLPIFLACEMSEPSLDTIFILMKLYPDLVYSTIDRGKHCYRLLKLLSLLCCTNGK
jgi:ankyrin repeat protein